VKLNISIRTAGDVLVVRCSGRLVAGEEVKIFQEQLRKELMEVPNIVLNTEGIEFVDSSGLGAIVRLMSAARAEGGDLKLCYVPAVMKKAIEITNLHRVLEICESENSAIAAACRQRKIGEGNGQHVPPAILCVDESPDVRAYMAQLLRRAGFSVLTSGNVADARVLAKAAKLRLIVASKQVCDALGGVCPEVPFVEVASGFSTSDAGEAGASLLDEVQKALAEK
jgi:anti-anti-sigma factor